MTVPLKLAMLSTTLLLSIGFEVAPRTDLQSASPDSYAAVAPCKTGFKRGKTPVSLVEGAKPGCYKISLAATGKKLLLGTNNTCFACHSAAGISPTSTTNGKLRDQGYTLQPASILSAFNAHQSEMSGASLTLAQAKAISSYLQSIK